MLKRTFIHIPGIGHETERSLWEQGCRDWDCFLADPKGFRVGTADPVMALDRVQESKARLEGRDHQFFRHGLGTAEAWRAYPDFRDSVAYLDIETDGRRSGDAVTVIGLYDGEQFQAWVKGDGLERFRDAISHYSMIVTFFGTGFDVPMLQKRFRGLVFDQIHLDLCPTLRKLGIGGGLKKIEKQLGIVRGEDTDGLDGLAAIRLWQAHVRGHDESALERLIAYNRDDVVNLETLAEYAYGKLSKAVFGKYR